MPKRRTKSVNDIVVQRQRIFRLGEELQRRDASSDKRAREIDNRVKAGRKTASSYIKNIMNSKAFDKDGGNDFVVNLRAYGRKYKNYQTSGKATAVG